MALDLLHSIEKIFPAKLAGDAWCGMMGSGRFSFREQGRSTLAKGLSPGRVPEAGIAQGEPRQVKLFGANTPATPRCCGWWSSPGAWNGCCCCCIYLFWKKQSIFAGEALVLLAKLLSVSLLARDRILVYLSLLICVYTNLLTSALHLHPRCQCFCQTAWNMFDFHIHIHTDMWYTYALCR